MATTESPASVNSEYDPTTDKARKAGSEDPGWKYGYWADLSKRNDVTCTLCGVTQKGGIRRLKQHLAGGYADAKLCESSKLTTAIRKEMRDYLEANKRKRPIFQDDEEATNVVQDEETRSKIDAQAMDYEKLRGNAFSNKLAIQNLESKNPIDWWCAYGGRAIELQRFARRIVSLCASSSGCERNWSTFEFIHTKKRNRLLHKRLNDIVFVSYNRKMKTRFQIRREKKGKSFDPLVLENFDWDNEWADSLHVPAQGGRGCDCDLGLTWQVLDEAVGASQALQGRNFPRRARHSTSAQAVEDEEEEEEEDPHDDAYVSDCEDASANSNDEGQDNGATNAIDEFDDGY